MNETTVNGALFCVSDTCLSVGRQVTVLRHMHKLCRLQNKLKTRTHAYLCTAGGQQKCRPHSLLHNNVLLQSYLVETLA